MILSIAVQSLTLPWKDRLASLFIQDEELGKHGIPRSFAVRHYSRGNREIQEILMRLFPLKDESLGMCACLFGISNTSLRGKFSERGSAHMPTKAFMSQDFSEFPVLIFLLWIQGVFPGQRSPSLFPERTTAMNTGIC